MIVLSDGGCIIFIYYFPHSGHKSTAAAAVAVNNASMARLCAYSIIISLARNFIFLYLR
jgi:hypothetical protein